MDAGRAHSTELSDPENSGQGTGLLYPLDRFAHDPQTRPKVARILGLEMPQPYRSLLVHEGDMTSRLEAFHGASIKLDVIARTLSSAVLSREVTLRLARNNRPVEYGAIEIELSRLPSKARDDVIQGRNPLGGILNEEKIPYSSRPQGFFSLCAGERLSRLLDCAPEAIVYGRKNRLYVGNDKVLATIVEILPPHEPEK